MNELFSDFVTAANAARVRAIASGGSIAWGRTPDGRWRVPAVEVSQNNELPRVQRRLNEDEARAVWGASEDKAFTGLTERVFCNGVLMTPDELASMDWRE